jgi:hypothetical protein
MTRDPERMTTMVEKLVRVGVLTPEEGRFLAADIFNREFRKIGDDWTKRPITLTLANIQSQGCAQEKVAGDPGSRSETRMGLLKAASDIIELREALVAEEDRINESRLALARQHLGQGADKPAEESS